MAWRRSGAEPMMVSLVYWRNYASLGLNELTGKTYEIPQQLDFLKEGHKYEYLFNKFFGGKRELKISWICVCTYFE